MNAASGFPSISEFAEFYAESVSERLAAGVPVREPCWAEAVAVGDETFIAEAEHSTPYRQSMERYEVAGPAGEKAWAVRETTIPYNADSDEKSAL